MSEGFKRKFTVTKQGGMISSLFRGWKEWEAGDQLMAVYMETKWSMYQGKEQPNHLCKVLECNFKTRNKEGVEQDPTDKVLTLNSAGQLNKLLVDASAGQVFVFTYEGKQRSSDPKDTLSYHTFSSLALVDAEECGDDLGL